MSKNENALTRVAAQDRARGKTMVSWVSCNHSTMALNVAQGQIAALLPVGEKNAIPTTELVKLSGLRSVRELQKQIESERHSGALILSSSTGGYFLPENRAEISRYVATLQRRAISTLRTLKTARQALKVLPNQEVLRDGEL